MFFRLPSFLFKQTTVTGLRPPQVLFLTLPSFLHSVLGTLEAEPTLRARVFPWGKISLAFVCLCYFQVPAYGVKVNGRQHFYSPRYEPGEGWVAGPKALVIRAAGHVELKGAESRRGRFPLALNWHQVLANRLCFPLLINLEAVGMKKGKTWNQMGLQISFLPVMRPQAI